MTWNPTLFHWRMRTLRPAMLLFAAINGIVVLWRDGILKWWFDSEVTCLLIAQGFVFSGMLGRQRSASELFLQTQGFSRASLWWHTTLAGMASVAVAWLPVAVCVWLPFRAAFQVSFRMSEWFPFGAKFEAAYPVHWLIHGWFWLAMFQHFFAKPVSAAVAGRSTGENLVAERRATEKPASAAVTSRSTDFGLILLVAMPLLFGRDHYMGEPGPNEQFWWTVITGVCAALLTVSHASRYRDVEVLP